MSMEVLSLLLDGFAIAFQPLNLGLIVAGAAIGLFIGIWELTFAMGLYSAKFLPPPHIFLGDLPNQLQHFDFSKANPGEAPATSCRSSSSRRNRWPRRSPRAASPSIASRRVSSRPR